MKLKELTVELSGNDNARVRSISLGPLTNGLNFIYGERGSGKSTIRNLVRELLLASADSQAFARAPIGCSKADITLECDPGRFQISRDSLGKITTTRVGGFGDTRNSLEPAGVSFHLESGVVDELSFIQFRNSVQQLERLYATLRNMQVPTGKDAAISNPNIHLQKQERAELQLKIDSLARELDSLRAHRTSLQAETATFNDHQRSSLSRSIGELTLRLSELDPNRIQAEIDTLKHEAIRLQSEIAATSMPPKQPAESSRYLPTLYRVLDEIDQHICEVRMVQTNVQRHRIRLKEEMEFRNSLTVEEENHPYHRARDILRQIEIRIDNADTRGDQWLEDHGTVDAQQVSRFIDETCSSVRNDLQSLCDELSNQYRELRNRSAIQELKELRHNFTHMSEIIQQALGRREAVVQEIKLADIDGAKAIEHATPEFCQLAASSGYFAAREQFVGPVSEQLVVTKSVIADTSLQQQQLAGIEARLTSLQTSLEFSQTESARISQQISELNTQKAELHRFQLVQNRENLALIENQILAAESSLLSLRTKLGQLPNTFVEPHSLLVSASTHLKQLSDSDFTGVWLSPKNGKFEIQDKQLVAHSVDALQERGVSQLVQLALVLAANESSSTSAAPLMLDDLFADIEKKRIDSTLKALSMWSLKESKQVIVLTQHRFLADRAPEASVWEIEPESNSAHWKPVTQKQLENIDSLSPNPFDPSWERPHQEVYSNAPIPEYPSSLLPRPYPLSKYPRTSDRDRAATNAPQDFFETYETPQIAASSIVTTQDFVDIAPIPQAATISPSVIGDRFDFPTIDETTAVDSIAMFDSSQLRCLDEHGIATLSDFFSLDPRSQSQDFITCYLAGESLEHLQASAWLMSWVPGLSANDARALVACGISEPEHLLTSNVDSLFERFARFLRSPDGRRFSSNDRTIDRSTVGSWQNRLRSNRNYRNQSRPRRSQSQSSDRHSLRAWSPNERSASQYSHERSKVSRNQSREHDFRGQGHNRRSDSTQHDSIPVRSPRMRTPEPGTYERRERRSRAPRKPSAVRQSTGERQTFRDQAVSNTESQSKSSSNPGSQKLRFYLDLTDHIEAAPSIGPKTAARFEAIGVYTISDFLKMTAESMAEKLDYKRLGEKVVRQWQNQTRLVCRIPNLRGHDAQLLVGCGIFEAEELASMRPESLFAKIAPFSETKEGLKIIRNGKKPDLAEVTDWISFAQHNRSLQAA